MAIIRVGNSGSSGNLYALETENETLLIELGMSWKDTLRFLDYKLEKVVAALCSHRCSHSDHSLSIDKAISNGIPVWSCRDVADIHKGVNVMELGKTCKVGGFSIQPLSVPHSVECYAYIIEHEEVGRLLFATDLTYFKYRIKGLKTIILEANYSEDFIFDNICDGEEIRSMSQNHMEIGDTIRSIRANYSSDLDNVILCHLSQSQGDKQAFKERIYDELGIMCEVAEKGTVIDLNKFDF